MFERGVPYLNAKGVFLYCLFLHTLLISDGYHCREVSGLCFVLSRWHSWNLSESNSLTAAEKQKLLVAEEGFSLVGFRLVKKYEVGDTELFLAVRVFSILFGLQRARRKMIFLFPPKMVNCRMQNWSEWGWWDNRREYWDAARFSSLVKFKTF